MSKIGLFSEDSMLLPFLSSALGKEFQIQLESNEEGMNKPCLSG
jgi:hypothetical protein